MSQATLRRAELALGADAIDALLDRAAVVHVATADAAGAPYVLPTLFVHERRSLLIHASAVVGRLRRNLAARPTACVELCEPGSVFAYGRYQCDSTISYASVIGFGPVTLEADRTAKAAFFDRFMAKYADPGWDRPPGFYPRLDDVVVLRIALEQVSGKGIALPDPAGQWPARDATRSPGAVPPG